jgi:hypothetical protein
VEKEGKKDGGGGGRECSTSGLKDERQLEWFDEGFYCIDE